MCACLLASASLLRASLPGRHVRLGQGSEGHRRVQGVPADQSPFGDEGRRQGQGWLDVEWNILGGSVQQLARLGIGKSGPNALKAGDEITVTIVPALDGKSPIGLLVAITYPDGHTVRFRSPDE